MMRIYISLFFILFVGTFSHSQNTDFELKPHEHYLKVPAEANLVAPSGVAINSQGHAFVVNVGTKKLMEFDAEGNFVRALAQGILDKPHGLRIDVNDNIWVTDVELHIVVKLSPEGRVLMVLGQSGNNGEYDKERQMALFFKPADIAFDTAGNIYVADGYGNSRIVKLDKHGNFIKAWGKKGTAEGDFDNPHNIVVDNKGLVYVADRHNNRIQIFDQDGNFQKAWTHLGKPWGLVLTKNQELFMTDGTNEKVLKVDLNGKIKSSYGSPGSKHGQFRAAHGIAVDDDSGSIYVTEILNWRVQKLALIKK